jgi:ABC-type Fe3+/spermidine/putrescine transport system ATPase subunit
MNEPILQLRRIRKRFADTVTARDITLDIARGEFFTLLGPSGSGKSTILRIIAGLEQPDSGEIRVDGKDVTHVPPWRRRLGMVFQQYANFPHLNVGGNVGYGLRRRGLGRVAIAERVAELLRLVGLDGFERRAVQQLSGGEQQRVAIARALAPGPTLLLLDEPLAALDEKIRREMQLELRSIQQLTGTTFIYVTHDQEEALTMSDRIAVLNRGECVQCDRPDRIFQKPRTAFVCGFFRGCNLLVGEVVIADAAAQLRIAGVPQPIPLPGPVPPGRAEVALRSERIAIGPAAASSTVTFRARLESVVYRGLYSEHLLRLADGQAITATLTQPPPVQVGSEVLVGIGAEHFTVLEREST